MSRLALGAALGAFALVLVGAPAASAHPLGNFTTSHLSQISASSERVEVRYILDQAEIPTFQERGLPASAVIERKQQEVERGLQLSVNGRRVALRPAGAPELTHPPGQGGLTTTRLELPLAADVKDPRRVVLRDRTFPGRVGWKAIVARAGAGTAARSDAPSGDPTAGLTRYPKELLQSPLDTRSASLTVRSGNGTLIAPRAPGAETVTTERPSESGFATVFERAAAGEGVLLLLLLSAFAWGAFHALSPGHGKAMVAAYLVGTRGTAKHAAVLGLTVTVTHTIGVFALGLVTLALAQYVLPEDLYPWLNLAAGLLVLVIGAGILRSRIRWALAQRARAHPKADAHHDSHGHHHAHGHGPGHEHGHGPGQHTHDIPDRVTAKGLIGMGASAGLIPCPSALVVLLGAVSQHQVLLGLLLIVVFSIGLAATLTVLGIAVVYAKRLTPRLGFTGRVSSALPALSAIVIFGVGLALTARALPQVV